MYAYSNQMLQDDTKKMSPRQYIFKKQRSSRRVIVVLIACSAIFTCATFTLRKPTSSATEDSRDDAVVSTSLESEDSWMLVLVNDDHPMKPFQPELTLLRGGQAVDSRCYPELQRMFDTARSAGLSPKVNSSYRSREEQQQLLNDTIAAEMEGGLSENAARQQALRTVAEPGTSEHETGLAIDVISEQQTWEANNAICTWMAEHSWEFGWILRYPADKEQITGIDYEPWHFRYVGNDAAQKMHENDQCLEEYLEQI